MSRDLEDSRAQDQQPITKRIASIQELMTSGVLEELASSSETGSVFAYTDAGLLFPVDQFREEIRSFNTGNSAAFDTSQTRTNFYIAGSSLKSVATGGAKSGGRIIEIQPSDHKVVAVYSQFGEKLENIQD